MRSLFFQTVLSSSGRAIIYCEFSVSGSIIGHERKLFVTFTVHCSLRALAVVSDKRNEHHSETMPQHCYRFELSQYNINPFIKSLIKSVSLLVYIKTTYRLLYVEDSSSSIRVVLTNDTKDRILPAVRPCTATSRFLLNTKVQNFKERRF